MSNVLNRNLPEEVLDSNLKETDNYIENLVKKELPRSDSKNIEKDLQWQFLLDKHASHDRKPRKIRKKKTFLTRRERKQLDILKLPKDGWTYDSLEPIREMWRQYMRTNLNLVNSDVPMCSDHDWGNFSTILSRCELIGSEVKVVRSKIATQVGMAGTVVLETKMTFQIVTPLSKLKIISKASSVFEFLLDNLKFTVFGKNIMTKPSERSVKKIKSRMLPDL